MDDRFGEFERWEEKLKEEQAELIHRYEQAVNQWQPKIYMCLRALVVLLPLASILLEKVVDSEFSWFSASGALITLLGILTQIYRGYVVDLVSDFQLVSLERNIGNSFYYAYKAKCQVSNGFAISAEDDAIYFRSILQSTGGKIRLRSRFLSNRKKTYELIFLLVGTLIWAYGSI